MVVYDFGFPAFPEHALLMFHVGISYNLLCENCFCGTLTSLDRGYLE